MVAFEPEVKESAGRVISGGDAADRFLLGLLRACADAVLVGAGTARDEAEHEWTPERASPSHAEEFAAVRRALNLAPKPPTYIVSRSGRLDADSRAVRTSNVISGGGDLREVVDSLRKQGHRRILTEGGPRLMGGLLQAGLVSDLFLTVAPVVAGRDGAGRRGLVEGARLLPDHGVHGQLLSARRSGDFLFLRYGLG